MIYADIHCLPKDGSPKRPCVQDYPISDILGTDLQAALHEARKVCSFEECDLEIRIRT
jgi:hypothetical protein